MSMTGCKARLTGATKELYLRWEQTKESWRDTKCIEFEQQYMIELLANVDKALTIIDQLDKLVAKIRHDCE
jgi:hypothetical protein